MKHIVTPQEHGMGLLSFLREKNREESISVKALKRAIDGKQCLVNGKVEYFSTHRLSTGDSVQLRITSEKRAAEKISTLFEDEHLLIVNKPAGVVVNSKISSHELVHRLDKETSGILIFAKTVEVKEKMVALFTERLIHKFYLAIVDGHLDEEGQMDDYLVEKSSYDGGVLYGISKKKEGKRAITFWKRLKQGVKSSLALVEPVTGRTHQIRVQFNAIGHSILGDFQYGRTFSCYYKPERHLLHSHRVCFVHPITKENLQIEAPLPQDFLDAQLQLKL